MDTTLPHHIMKRRQKELLNFITLELISHELADLTKSPYYSADILTSDRVAILSETGKVLETFEPSESPSKEKKRAKAFIQGLLASPPTDGLAKLRAWAKATLELRDSSETGGSKAPDRAIVMTVASGSEHVKVSVGDLRSFLQATEPRTK